VSFRIKSVDVVATQLTAHAEALRRLLPLLSDIERERASQFAFERDRRRFIVGRAVLRQLLGERLGVEPEAVEIEYGSRGKPALARRYEGSRLRFNLSHCDDVAVYAFACGVEIGLDVEAVHTLDDADQIAARFFSHRENEAYRALDSHDRPLGFFHCWTRKEAFVKALGEGLHYPLDAFDVSLGPDEPARILRVGNTPGDQCPWRLHSFSPAPGVVGAVVTERL
jgi:4'-phosphopantetheinyl transferase